MGDGEDDEEFEGFVDTEAPGAKFKFKAPQGDGDEVLELNLAEVMAARQAEAEARSAAWQKTFMERKNRLEPDELRRQKREKAKKERKVRLICLDLDSDEEKEVTA